MTTVEWLATTKLPTRYGQFIMSVYHGQALEEQIVLTVGSIDASKPLLVRVHSECLTGDVFGSARCDCGDQLSESLHLLQAEGRGALLYLRQEGRGIGLANKIRAYHLQDQGLDTVDANRHLGLADDKRDYADAAAILRDIGVSKVRLITNNPLKIAGLETHGIKVVERLPLHITPNATNSFYIRTKQERMGHLRPAERTLGLD